MSEKKAILEKIVDTLRSEYEVLAKALVDSSAAATDPDSKAEGKYDTRSLEMSYLASGQARQAQVLEESIALLDSLSCLLYTSPSPRDLSTSRMPSSA